MTTERFLYLTVHRLRMAFVRLIFPPAAPFPNQDHHTLNPLCAKNRVVRRLVRGAKLPRQLE